MLHPLHIPSTLLKHPLLDQLKVELEVMRLDQVHPTVSGNKFFKLKYNLAEALKQNHRQVLTFGGAYSNHIYATAAAAKLAGLQSIGIIRGEVSDEKNPTLRAAKDSGMVLKSISRELYRDKIQPEFIDQLHQEWGEFYLIPEGGTNALAIQGTTEILSSSQFKFSHLATPIGTGGTFAGLANSILPQQELLGISALKGEGIQEEMKQLLHTHRIQPQGSHSIWTQYHHGGYAKWSSELIEFIHWFWESFGIPLDPIYTGKMAFACWDLLQKKYFKPGSRVLLIHTGGLQGSLGFTQRTGIELPSP
jgi:1-aminocyclopropane-1-carboxylate deaminase/D-cysteine desulfhydrase-like pyridoxal-dependent ACC family enzyme